MTRYVPGLPLLFEAPFQSFILLPPFCYSAFLLLLAHSPRTKLCTSSNSNSTHYLLRPSLDHSLHSLPRPWINPLLRPSLRPSNAPSMIHCPAHGSIHAGACGSLTTMHCLLLPMGGNPCRVGGQLTSIYEAWRASLINCGYGSDQRTIRWLVTNNFQWS